MQAPSCHEQRNLQAVVSDRCRLIPFLSLFYEVICSLGLRPNVDD